MNAAPVPPVIAEAVRGGFGESRHRGTLVVLAPGGRVAHQLGDPRRPMFPRSSAKPLQAVALLHPGDPLHGETLAVAAGSHTGQPRHIAAVRHILASAGLDESALATPAALPWPPEPYLRSGGHARPVLMNCSGQHAAMLALCVAEGWPTDGYLHPDHPVQQRVRTGLEALTGEHATHTGVDGCGAPVLAFTLLGLARGFQRVATARPGTPAHRVAAAMRAHPYFVSGEDGFDTRLMTAVPGLLAKAGAEAVQCLALPDGSTLALSVEDGTKRAVGPAVAAVLRHLLPASPGLAARLSEVENVCASPLPGPNGPTGEVRAAFTLPPRGAQGPASLGTPSGR
ncbi:MULTISPECIES: asparaginase [unclassified Streptomyces]|uniref:asparaginase n=1 Tax=unclassified Streptomyces TaxID=2593676 RepID=UPI003806333C